MNFTICRLLGAAALLFPLLLIAATSGHAQSFDPSHLIGDWICLTKVQEADDDIEVALTARSEGRFSEDGRYSGTNTIETTASYVADNMRFHGLHAAAYSGRWRLEGDILTTTDGEVQVMQAQLDGFAIDGNKRFDQSVADFFSKAINEGIVRELKSDAGTANTQTVLQLDPTTLVVRDDDGHVSHCQR